MTDIALRKDIGNYLLNINSAYLDSQDNPFMGGKTTTKPEEAAIFTDDTMKTLFETQYGTTAPFSLATTKTVYVLKKGQTKYTSIADNYKTNIYDKLNITSTDAIVDINVMHCVSSQAVLKALYATYDLMSETNWAVFKTKVNDIDTITVKNGTIGSDGTSSTESVQMNSTTTTVFDSVITLSTLKSLRTNNKFVPFAFRRLLYLYIRMYSFYVAMAILNGSVTADNAALCHSIFALIDSGVASLTNDSLKRTTNGINNRIERYNKYISNINDIDAEFATNQKYVKTQKERAASETNEEGKINIFMYVALVVFLVAMIASAVPLFTTQEFTSKVTLGLGAVAFSAIAGIIILALFSNKVVEGFASLNSPGNTFANWDAYKPTYNTAILEVAREYVRNVMMLMQSLGAYRALGNSMYSMAKENEFYTTNNMFLRNTGNKYKASHRASDLYQKQAAATTYLFVVMSMLASTIVLGFVATQEKMPMLTPFVLWGGGIVVFIALVIYVLEMSSYVRTDGDKKYWGVPEGTTF